MNVDPIHLSSLFIFFTYVLINYFLRCFFSQTFFGKITYQRTKTILSFVTIVKNEGPYIKEWIEYHKIVGVSKFFIYDNQSEDNLTEILKPYIKSGQVIYKFFPGRSVQLLAYNDAIHYHKYKTKYMGFFDVDEFVIPVKDRTLIQPIKEIMESNSNISSIAINWHVYGSSGFKNKPKGLVIENYKYRSISDHHFKTICDPQKVFNFTWNPHSLRSRPHFFSVNENGEKIGDNYPYNENCQYQKLRINHYRTKSFNEFQLKNARGRADANFLNPLIVFNETDDQSTVYDYIMEKYVPELKRILNIT